MSGAIAQWNPSFTASLGRGYGRIALSQSVIGNTRRIGTDDPQTTGDGTLAKSSAATQGPEGTLTFTADPAVSDRTRAEVIDTLSQQTPELRSQMEYAFADNKVLKDFARFTAAHGGYSSHNVADDMATLLVVSWEIITGVTANAAQIRGAHQQVRHIFLSTTQLRAMNNAERQQMAERIAYQVVISSSARDQCLRSHDRQHLAELRDSAAGVMRRQGIELSGLQLTDQGFIRHF
jgi:hypothetical protein